VKLLRYWLLISGVSVGAMAAWAFAPVLVLVLVLLAGLGVLSAAMIYLAGRLRIWRGGK
jgi:hypothetical protein